MTTASFRARALSRRAFSLAAAGLALSFAAGAPLAAQSSGPTLVVLVRHGEKAAEPAGDPPLSAAGQARAEALLDALAHNPPIAIFVSPTKRTHETAQFVAGKFGVKPTAISLAGGGAAHVAAVAAAVLKQRGVVLVVGHSNTIPAIVKALGGPALPDLCDASYATMFVLQPGTDGKPATLVRAHYGAADPALGAGCAPMSPR